MYITYCVFTYLELLLEVLGNPGQATVYQGAWQTQTFQGAWQTQVTDVHRQQVIMII